MCIFILARFSTSASSSLVVLVVPSPQIYINELRKSSNVTGWKCPQVGQQHVTPSGIGLEGKCENITSESRGDVTCDSLGDVTLSHGTHDVKRSVGKVRRIWMRKQHQEGQSRIVMSTRGVCTTVVSNK